MKKKPSKEDITKIIAKILKMSVQKVEKIDNYTKMDSWDSLAQLDIISALDKKLSGKILIIVPTNALINEYVM